MDKAEFLGIIKEIGTIEDETERRTKLSDLESGVSSIFDLNSELTETNTNLKNDNETLRSANMKLFLRIGEQKEEKIVTENNTGIKNDEKAKREFKDLFDEKGGIK